MMTSALEITFNHVTDHGRLAYSVNQRQYKHNAILTVALYKEIARLLVLALR